MKILILNAHPDRDSLISALADSYYKGCVDGSHEVMFIRLIELGIDWIMRKKYLNEINREPEVKRQQELIKGCTHLVIFSPNYWWNMPALLKGYIERVFTYGFASDYKDTFPYVIPLLKGHSARVVYTQNTSKFIGILGRGDRFWKNINHSVLKHCGFSPTYRTVFGPVKNSTEEHRRKWIETAYRLGKEGK